MYALSTRQRTTFFRCYYSPEFSRYSRTQYLTRDGIGVELIRQVCMDGEGVVGEGGGSQPRTSATRRRAREAQQLRRDGAGIRGSGQGCRESRQGWSTESSRRTRRHLCRLTATTPDAAQPPRVCAESAFNVGLCRAASELPRQVLTPLLCTLRVQNVLPPRVRRFRHGLCRLQRPRAPVVGERQRHLGTRPLAVLGPLKNQRKLAALPAVVVGDCVLL